MARSLGTLMVRRCPFVRTCATILRVSERSVATRAASIIRLPSGSSIPLRTTACAFSLTSPGTSTASSRGSPDAVARQGRHSRELSPTSPNWRRLLARRSEIHCGLGGQHQECYGLLEIQLDRRIAMAQVADGDVLA